MHARHAVASYAIQVAPVRFSSRAFSTATFRKLHAGPTALSQAEVCFKGRIVVDQGSHLGQKDDCDFQQQHTTWGSLSSSSVSKCHGFVWCCACRCILLHDCSGEVCGFDRAGKLRQGNTLAIYRWGSTAWQFRRFACNMTRSSMKLLFPNGTVSECSFLGLSFICSWRVGGVSYRWAGKRTIPECRGRYTLHALFGVCVCTDRSCHCQSSCFMSSEDSVFIPSHLRVLHIVNDPKFFPGTRLVCKKLTWQTQLWR